MLNSLLQIKIKERLNKLASHDYDNIESWQIQEAFNKAQLEWVRRQLHGTNPYKEGDEQSKRRVDDLQPLLIQAPLQGRNKELFFESAQLPADYMEFKRVSTKAKSECCPPRNMVVYQVEEANIDNLLRDELSEPSFMWGETFCTLFGNQVRIYTNGKFEIVDPQLIYYRQPRAVRFKGSTDPATATIQPVDITCEFRDDVAELLVDDAAAILAGDLESVTQYQRLSQASERNN